MLKCVLFKKVYIMNVQIYLHQQSYSNAFCPDFETCLNIYFLITVVRAFFFCYCWNSLKWRANVNFSGSRFPFTSKFYGRYGQKYGL